MSVSKDKFEHRSISQLMGSWPFTIDAYANPPMSGNEYTLFPSALVQYATILSTRKEPAAGYNLDATSFYLWVDDSVITNPPQQHLIDFGTTGSNWTLAQVVSEINSDVGETVAYDDNGFLRLQSPRSGQTSYLRIETFNTPDVLNELGLFAETIVVGGEPTSLTHVDPIRQTAYPGQLSMLNGESFNHNVFNRIALSMALSTDRVHNLVAKKRLAVKKELVTTYTDPGSPQGITIPGYVYTGPSTFSSPPTSDELEDIVAVLDAVGSEIVLKREEVLGAISTATEVYVHENGRVTVTDTDFTWDPIAAGDPNEDYYIVLRSFPSAPSFVDIPLKIVSDEAPSDPYQCVVQAVHPDTGQLLADLITRGIDHFGTSEKVEITKNKVKASGLYDSQGGSRIEKSQTEKVAATSIDRIELNNRIWCDGATFETANVAEGDLVVIASTGQTDPYDNAGNYRVSKVIDEETLELVGEDFGPIILNPIEGGGYGTAQVLTDGEFWLNPFLQFTTDPSGAYVDPEGGSTVRVNYLGMSSFLDAAGDDPAFLAGPSIRYTQEMSQDTKTALLNIWGSSAQTADDLLYPSDNLANMNLERLNVRLNYGHYDDTGRHSTIYPDEVWVGDPDDSLLEGTLNLQKDGVRWYEGNSSNDLAAGSLLQMRSYGTAGATYVPGAAGIWTGTSSAAPSERMVVLPDGSVYFSIGSTGSLTPAQTATWTFSNEASDSRLAVSGTGQDTLLIFQDDGDDKWTWRSQTAASHRYLALLSTLATNIPSNPIVQFDGQNRRTTFNSFAEGDAVRISSEGGTATPLTRQTLSIENLAYDYGTGSATIASHDVYTYAAPNEGFNSWTNATLYGSNVRTNIGGEYNSSTIIGVRSLIDHDFDSTSGLALVGVKGEMDIDADATNVYSFWNSTNIASGKSISDDVYGFKNDVSMNGDCNILYGAYTSLGLNFGSDPGTVYGHRIFAEVDDSLATTDFYGLRLDISVLAGGLNNIYGLYLGDYNAAAGGTAYGVYQLGTSVENIFQGPVYATEVGTNSATSLALVTNSTEQLIVTSTGKFGTNGETSPDIDPGGICIYLDSLAPNALSIKQNGFNNPFYNFFETDTFAMLRGWSATTSSGILNLVSCSDINLALELDACAGTTSSVTGSGALGAMHVKSATDNGAGSFASMGNNDNLFTVANNANTRFIIKGDGDIRTATGSVAIFDGEEDAVACRDLAYVISDKPGDIWKYNQEAFNRIGIMEGGFLSLHGATGLILGGVGEIYQVLDYVLKNMLNTDYDTIRKLIRQES